MKISMDGDTLLFIGDDFSLAYNRQYLRLNHKDIEPLIRHHKHVYYKVDDRFNSWINYKYAIKNNYGSYEDRIKSALSTPYMKLSPNLIEIPQTIYTDIDGDQHVIFPNDGKIINNKCWHKRKDYLLEQPEYEPIYREVNNGWEDASVEIDLKVKFKQKISDCLISLNNFFLDYEQLNDYEIFFRGIRKKLYFMKPFEKTENDKNFEFDCGIVYWENVKKDKVLKPYVVNGRRLKFREKLRDTSLLFYNGIIYNFKLVAEDEIEIDDEEINLATISLLDVSDFHLVMFKTGIEQEGLELKKIIIKGVNNILPNESQFRKDIRNALVCTGNLHYAYHLQDKYSVKIPRSTGGTWAELQDDTPCYAYFFYTGKIGFDSIGLESDEIKDEKPDNGNVAKPDRPMFNDYKDFLHESTIKNFFKIKYKPIKDTVRLFINGVRYEQDVHFKFDSDALTIKWTFEKKYGGFDLRDSYTIIAVYDFYFDENNIVNIPKFNKDYQIELERMKLN